MLALIVLLPLLSAAVVAYFRNSWSKTMISVVACGSVLLSFVLTLVNLVQFHGEPIHQALWSWGSFLDFGLLGDSLSLWWAIVITGAGFLIHVYSVGYMEEDQSYGRFMAELNYFVFAMSLLVLADNFGGLLMGWANVGLASYLLIGYYFTKPSAQNAAMKAFVMNIIGEVGMVAGIAFIYYNYGSLNFSTVFEKVAENPGPATLIGLLLLVGACAKSAQLPLHTWLPFAMEGPTPVSALMHAATMVTGGVYLVSRAYPFYAASGTAAMAVAWVGALGALIGALIAVGQNDIKRVLAFSTLSQIGYMFLGNGLGAYMAADFHFFTHAFFKAALFLNAGIIVHHYHTQDIRQMGGAFKKDRFAGWMWVLAACALIGIPGFSGFFSKDEILVAAYNQGLWGLFAVGMLAAGFTALYNTRLFSLVFLGNEYKPLTKHVGNKKRPAAEAGHGHDAHAAHHATPATMKFAVGVLSILAVVGGYIAFPGWQEKFLESSFELIHPEPFAGFHIQPVVASIAILMAVLGIGIGWVLYGPNGSLRASELDLNAKPGPLLSMLYFDDIYQWIFIEPAKAIAGFISDVADARLVDGMVNGLGSVAAGIGSGLRVLQNGYIRRYALTFFSGVALMIVYYVFYV
jgi:NADH-quinone oxidoreductase subunit L